MFCPYLTTSPSATLLSVWAAGLETGQYHPCHSASLPSEFYTTVGPGVVLTQEHMKGTVGHS